MKNEQQQTATTDARDNEIPNEKQAAWFWIEQIPVKFAYLYDPRYLLQNDYEKKTAITLIRKIRQSSWNSFPSENLT